MSFARYRSDRRIRDSMSHTCKKHTKDLGALGGTRHTHLDLAVKAPRTPHRAVKRIGTIRGAKHEDTRALAWLLAIVPTGFPRS